MDFMPDKEFHKLFDRISIIVDLRGAATPREINKRLNRKIKEYRYLSRKGQLASFRASRMPDFLKRLISAGFGMRTIDEAVANPRGKIALTLKYGRGKARRILRKRAQRRLRW